MTQYYFDNAAGSDSNSGLVTGSPKQTMSALKALVLAGNILSLKRGSVWTRVSGAQVLDLNGKNPAALCTINDYGSASAPPILDGLVYDNSATGWTHTGSGRWTKSVAASVGRVMFGGSISNLGIGGLGWAFGSSTSSSNEWWWNAGTLHIYTGSTTVSPPVFYGGLAYVTSDCEMPSRARNSSNIKLERIRTVGGFYFGFCFQPDGADVTDIQGDDLEAMYLGNAKGFGFEGSIAQPTSYNRRITLNRPVIDMKTDATENAGVGSGTAQWVNNEGIFAKLSYDDIVIYNPTIIRTRHGAVGVLDMPGFDPGKFTVIADKNYGVVDLSVIEYGHGINHIGSLSSQNSKISGLKIDGQPTRSQISGTVNISGCTWKNIRYEATINGFEASHVVWFQSWDMGPGNSQMIDVTIQNCLIEDPWSAAFAFQKASATAGSFDANKIKLLNNTIIDLAHYNYGGRRTFQTYGGTAVPAQIIQNNNLIVASAGGQCVSWDGTLYTINAKSGFSGNVENVEGYEDRGAGDYHPTLTGGLKSAGVLGLAGALDADSIALDDPPSIAPLEYVEPSAPLTDPTGGWKPWPGAILATADVYQFRVKIGAGATRGEIRAMNLLIEVPDITEVVPDVVVAAAGTVILHTKPFTAILAVQATLQANSSGGVRVEIDKADPLAPSAKVYNSSDVAVGGAKVDFTLQGY